jgi:hypothetical protein
MKRRRFRVVRKLLLLKTLLFYALYCCHIMTFSASSYNQSINQSMEAVIPFAKSFADFLQLID